MDEKLIIKKAIKEYNEVKSIIRKHKKDKLKDLYAYLNNLEEFDVFNLEYWDGDEGLFDTNYKSLVVTIKRESGRNIALNEIDIWNGDALVLQGYEI